MPSTVRAAISGRSALFEPYGRLVQNPRIARGRFQHGIRSRQQNRHASATAQVASAGASRILNFVYGTTLVLGLGIVFVYVTDTRASVHRWVVVPTLRWVYQDPEKAHEIGNRSLKALWLAGLHPRERGDPDASGDLAIEVFGTTLKNPIGTSAGIDKHADIPDPLMALGPAIIEIGGTTPQPQPGNEKPRVFRLTSQNAMINRYGLNSEGADRVATRLRQRVREFAQAKGLGYDESAEKRVLDGELGVPPGSLTPGKLLAVNIAKNKATPENDIQAVAADYVYCVDRLAPYADIVVVNVSSPNTPGLRSLQKGESLKQILTAVVRAAKSTDRRTKPAVMVKVSPDEDSDEQISGICQAVWESGVDGVIVGNTTNRRPPALPHLHQLSPTEEQYLMEQGGFSGPHLFEKTVALTKKYKQMLNTSPHTLLSNPSEAEKTSSPQPTSEVSKSIETESIPLKNLTETPDGEKQSLFQLPMERFYDQSIPEQNQLKQHPSDKTSAPSSLSAELSEPQLKVIFATGGITNGKQALEVLNAGASVAMVYTALVYGGAGTISRIKDEMRTEIKNKSTKKKTTKAE